MTERPAEKILRGLDQALKHARGERTAKEHRIPREGVGGIDGGDGG